jgi:hypothetical protein
MIVRIGDFIAKPYGNTCWQLFEHKPERMHHGKVVEPGWVSMDVYPHDLEHAVRKIAEYSLLEAEGEHEGVDEIVAAIKQLTMTLQKEVERGE